jgi:hypothetical protein
MQKTTRTHLEEPMFLIMLSDNFVVVRAKTKVGAIRNLIRKVLTTTDEDLYASVMVFMMDHISLPDTAPEDISQFNEQENLLPFKEELLKQASKLGSLAVPFHLDRVYNTSN